MSGEDKKPYKIESRCSKPFYL